MTGLINYASRTPPPVSSDNCRFGLHLPHGALCLVLLGAGLCCHPGDPLSSGRSHGRVWGGGTVPEHLQRLDTPLTEDPDMNWNLPVWFLVPLELESAVRAGPQPESPAGGGLRPQATREWYPSLRARRRGGWDWLLSTGWASGLWRAKTCSPEAPSSLRPDTAQGPQCPAGPTTSHSESALHQASPHPVDPARPATSVQEEQYPQPQRMG